MTKKEVIPLLDTVIKNLKVTQDSLIDVYEAMEDANLLDASMSTKLARGVVDLSSLTREILVIRSAYNKEVI